jgi:hypothetical protein
MSSAGSARSFYCHGGTARGPLLAAGAVGELDSARSPGAVGRKKHGFRGGFGRRGSCSWFRANFMHRLGERTEFFCHRERFLVTSLHNNVSKCLFLFILPIITSNIPTACQIIDNLTCPRGYFGRLFPEKNLHDK